MCTPSLSIRLLTEYSWRTTSHVNDYIGGVCGNRELNVFCIGLTDFSRTRTHVRCNSTFCSGKDSIQFISRKRSLPDCSIGSVPSPASHQAPGASKACRSAQP